MRLRLREIRERRFLTQQELAEILGTSRANVSRMETGAQRPSPRTIRRIAEKLGVEPGELVAWDDGEAPTGLAKEIGKGKAARA